METYNNTDIDITEPSRLMEAYLMYLRQQKNRSPKTVESYYNDFVQFGTFLINYFQFNSRELVPSRGFRVRDSEMDRYFPMADESAAHQYVDVLSEKGFSHSSIGRKLTAIKGFYRYLESRNHIRQNPFESIEIIRDDDVHLDYLQEPQLGRLFETIGTNSWLSCRDRAILAVLYNTGMRVGELLNLKPEDVDENDGSVQIRAKGKKTRTCKLWGWVLDAVRDYLNMRQKRQLYEPLETGILFINRDSGPLTARSVRRKLKQYSRQAGLSTEVTPAMLRHSCAMHMLQRGAGIKAVRSQLGHLSSSSIRPYLKTLDQQPVFQAKPVPVES